MTNINETALSDHLTYGDAYDILAEFLNKNGKYKPSEFRALLDMRGRELVAYAYEKGRQDEKENT